MSPVDSETDESPFVLMYFVPVIQCTFAACNHTYTPLSLCVCVSVCVCVSACLVCVSLTHTHESTGQ